MPELIKLDRLCPVLVRCGACRFTCAAQDCAHLLECIAAGGDYVRDVSFPVGASDRAASWVAGQSFTDVNSAKLGTFLQPKGATHALKPAHSTGYVDAWTREARGDFNEGDCGGVFDGFGVTSDADPGL